MSEIKMLPLPTPNGDYTNPYDGDDLENYARANVLHHTAAQAAEIEALRAIIDNREAIIATHAADTREYQKQLMHAQARAERLAEAIKAYKSECDNPAKDYVLRAKRRDEMFALLHGHDQEVGNG